MSHTTYVCKRVRGWGGGGGGGVEIFLVASRHAMEIKTSSSLIWYHRAFASYSDFTNTVYQLEQDFLRAIFSFLFKIFVKYLRLFSRHSKLFSAAGKSL